MSTRLEEIVNEHTEDPFAAVLEVPIVPTYSYGSSTRPRKEIPESIATVLELSYQEYFNEVKTPEGKILKAGSSKYRHFKLPSEELAKQFKSHALRWAKYREPEQCSVRCFPLESDPTTLRFAALPLQKRETRRLPGSDS